MSCQRCPFLFVAHEHVVQQDLRDLSLFFSCLRQSSSHTLLLSPLLLMQCLHQLPNGLSVISCSILSCSHGRGLRLSKLFLFLLPPLFLLTSRIQHRSTSSILIMHTSFVASLSICSCTVHEFLQHSGSRWPPEHHRHFIRVRVVDPSQFSSYSDLFSASSCTRLSSCSLESSGHRSRSRCTIPAVRTPRCSSSTVVLTGQRSFDVSVRPRSSCCTSCRPERFSHLASPSTRIGLPFAAANLTVFVAFVIFHLDISDSPFDHKLLRWVGYSSRSN